MGDGTSGREKMELEVMGRVRVLGSRVDVMVEIGGRVGRSEEVSGRTEDV